MDSLIRFGSGDESYTFNQNHIVSLSDNFKDLVQQATRLPGLSGGINEYGISPSPRPVGNVRATFWLFSDEHLTVREQSAQMESLKQDLNRMSTFGVKRLYKQPVDSNQIERYCEASISRISYTEAAVSQSYKRLRVTVDWQVTNPRWYSQGTEAPSWGDGSSWGTGSSWGGTAPKYSLTGLSTEFSLTTLGNAETYPRIILTIPSGSTAENIHIQRLQKGVIVDAISYQGLLGSESRLVINTRASSVTLNGASHYTEAFTYNNAGWFRLSPSTNTIRVLMENPTDACDLEFRYYEAYT